MYRLYVALILVAEISFLAVLPFVAPGIPMWISLAILPLTLVAAYAIHRIRNSAAYRMRRLSPDEITHYDSPSESGVENGEEDATPEELSRLIVERTAEIRRTLTESPSEIRIEMCALGYRACVNDMISLTHLSNEEFPNAGFLRRIALLRARKKATDALTATRKALPQSALRATHQEQQ
ncbi:MAG TPA: hypothetical protein VHM16_08625 [Rubrobacteraceae bacterium]|nr:hypothetical protein [Rubrobacteraceae bacterium]